MGIRVVLADDHAIVRKGLRSILEDEEDIEVIGEAENGRELLRLVQEILPDVVVMDVVMPDLNGMETTRQIIARAPDIKVLALSMYSDRRFIRGMLGAGALGYLLKDCAVDELVQAVRTVVADQTYLSPAIAQIVVKDYIDHLDKLRSSAFALLTSREREVLQLLAGGMTTKEIALKTDLSVDDIETHCQQIMDKLDIHSIAGLTKYAIREGLTSIDT